MATYDQLSARDKAAMAAAAAHADNASILSAANSGSYGGIRYTDPTSPVAPSTPTTPAGTPGGNKATTSLVTPPTTPSYISGLNVTEPDKASLQAQARAAIQAQVDAINSVYNDKITNVQKLGEENLGGTRSVNARAGLVGSDFEMANLNNTKKDTADAIAQVQNDRNNTLQTLWAKADELANTQYNNLRTEALTNQKTVFEYTQKMQQDAKDNVAAIAKNSGYQFEDLVPADQEMLLKETGLDAISMKALWNENLPDNLKQVVTNTPFKGSNGNLWSMRSTYNPVTKKVTNDQWDTGTKYVPDADIHESNGYFYNYDKTTGQLTKLGGPGPTGAKDTTNALDPQEAKTNQWLQQVVDPSTGKLSMANWNIIRSDWLNNGKTGQSFDDKFADYSPYKKSATTSETPTTDAMNADIAAAKNAFISSTDPKGDWPKLRAQFISYYPSGGEFFDSAIPQPK